MKAKSINSRNKSNESWWLEVLWLIVVAIFMKTTKSNRNQSINHFISDKTISMKTFRSSAVIVWTCREHNSSALTFLVCFNISGCILCFWFSLSHSICVCDCLLVFPFACLWIVVSLKRMNEWIKRKECTERCTDGRIKETNARTNEKNESWHQWIMRCDYIA